MSTSLNDLGAAPLPQTEVDMGNLPPEGGGFGPLLPPGPYLLELSPLSAAHFTKVEVNSEYAKGDRVSVKFDATAPLVIKQSVGGAHDGEPLQTQLSNVERPRGKKTDPKRPLVSDWDYLNAALGVATRPTSNRGFAEQLIKDSAARKSFRADWEWSWSCNANRDAYFDNGAGSSGPAPDPNSPGNNIKGCGKRYYQNDIEKVEGSFPERITCECGANVRAFGNLRGFKASS